VAVFILSLLVTKCIVQMGNPVFCIFIYLFFLIKVSSLLYNFVL